MLRINTVDGRKRMSTQDLLLKIAEAVKKGETDFYVTASGQHDIGGPLWSPQGLPLRFTVINPGQRVGSMCLPDTVVTVEGPAPADVGWLNSGGTVAVRGDAGDTAGHCAAGGKIYIGGRAGTRSGSLMKHDPEKEPPELWILESTGSFSFEFMGGGKAVVCGHNGQTLPSVLGERPCVGMVGGVVYFRGPAPELPPDVAQQPLDDEDIAWLDEGLDHFLEAVGKSRLKKELSFWKHWRKLLPARGLEKNAVLSVAEFRNQDWFSAGLFGDVLKDDFAVASLAGAGDDRLNVPRWQNDGQKCVDCRACIRSCPQGAVLRRKNEDAVAYGVNDERCIGCGICAAVCPNAVWRMRQNQPLE